MTKSISSGSGIVSLLLRDVPLPRMVKISQQYERPVLLDIEAAFLERLRGAGVLSGIKPGMSVAVGVGSRGITDQERIIKLLIAELKAKGAAPFIFPAMGSHGGATAAGQQAMLEGMGYSAEAMGAPIRATMEVVGMGAAENGLTCWFDAAAAGADGIIIVNRVKPHVAFRGRYESGLMKMLAIGLGKQKGADTCHNLGMGRMEENILALGRRAIATGKILFGVALLENAYHELCRIEVLPAGVIEAEEPALQAHAKSLEPRIPFDQMDVLIIDEIGKNISGTGFDTNVVGRCHTPFISCERPRITRIAALDITEESHGNANGLGILDFTTRRAFEKFSFDDTYPNSLTSTVPLSVKIPMVLKNDREAIQAAIKTCNIPDHREVRLGRIKNTLQAHLLEISETLLAEARANPALEILGEPYELPFDPDGNLF
ncbi:MAG: lactate racemase domain-containing protein [Smithellaceae bacterium]|nr:lactate racemase domain-containing protein [Smithellaceae bacterium]